MLRLAIVFVCFSFSLALSGWQKEVLDKHNALRSKVALGKEGGAPTAKWMQKMVSKKL